jgi:hypothetical protein
MDGLDRVVPGTAPSWVSPAQYARGELILIDVDEARSTRVRQICA